MATIFFSILGYFCLFFNFICNFFQSCYLIFNTQKVTRRCKEQNEKRIMTIDLKSYSKSKNVKKTQNFSK